MASLDKKSLRKTMIAKRNNMDTKDVIEMSKIIFEKVKEVFEYKSAKTIMLYSSVNNEVYTNDMINDIKKTGRQTFLPVLVSNTDMCAVLDNGEYEKNAYGILEPTGEAFESCIDVIICPAVAYDINLHRLGYGGGYYDRFLKKYPKAFKIGLAYDYQIADDIYSDKYDVPMDMVISEKRIIKI